MLNVFVLRIDFARLLVLEISFTEMSGVYFVTKDFCHSNKQYYMVNSCQSARGELDGKRTKTCHCWL